MYNLFSYFRKSKAKKEKQSQNSSQQSQLEWGGGRLGCRKNMISRKEAKKKNKQTKFQRKYKLPHEKLMILDGPRPMQAINEKKKK